MVCDATRNVLDRLGPMKFTFVNQNQNQKKNRSTFFHNFNYVRFIMRWLKVTFDTGMLSRVACQTLSFSVHRIGHSHSIIENAKRKDFWISGWLSVDQIISFDRSIMTHKIVNKQCPESLWNKYNQRIEISSCSTRSNRNLELKAHLRSSENPN